MHWWGRQGDWNIADGDDLVDLLLLLLLHPQRGRLLDGANMEEVVGGAGGKG
jgi:hypothetical protein